MQGNLCNRYLIYELKNRKISSNIPKRFGGYEIDGVVKEVRRDILENQIHLRVDKDMYVFREPDYITKDEKNAIVFIYGDINQQETSDEQLLEQMHNTALKGGDIDNVIESLENESITYIKFNIIS
jgi:hypothetical protein